MPYLDTTDKYQFTFLPLKKISELQLDWQTLESKTQCNFFLSWAWISTWIESYEPEVKVLRAYLNGELIAVAAFVYKSERRHIILSSRVVYLNQTGDSQKDQIWIEYNGILALEEHKQAVSKASIRYLFETPDSWDEIIVGAIADCEASLLEQGSNLMRHDLWEAPCYGIDLKNIRENNGDYLSTLSRNTRYQIRRSIKLYSKRGEIIIESADSKEAALKYFQEIGPAHMVRWGSNIGESGFANPHFMLFHEKLIEKCWENGSIELLRIKAGERVIAWFYNFIYRNRVYFYLSGLLSENESKLKPGLTGHSLCIQRYLENGFDFYDFMGGTERYKESLAEKHNHLVKMTLQKRKIKFLLERVGRKIKRKIYEK